LPGHADGRGPSDADRAPRALWCAGAGRVHDRGKHPQRVLPRQRSQHRRAIDLGHPTFLPPAPVAATELVGDPLRRGEAVQSWKEIRDERNGPQYAVASWLTLAGCAYLTALETGVEVEPMEIARWLTRALAWTAAELAASEDEPQPLLS
jgi:hypothetical protein